MQTTVRTTLRIRKDLLDQSRTLAFNRGKPLQDIINQTLAIGYKHITDLNSANKSMKQIDDFRRQMVKKNINFTNLLKTSKSDQK